MEEIRRSPRALRGSRAALGNSASGCGCHLPLSARRRRDPADDGGAASCRTSTSRSNTPPRDAEGHAPTLRGTSRRCLSASRAGARCARTLPSTLLHRRLSQRDGRRLPCSCSTGCEARLAPGQLLPLRAGRRPRRRTRCRAPCRKRGQENWHRFWPCNGDQPRVLAQALRGAGKSVITRSACGVRGAHRQLCSGWRWDVAVARCSWRTITGGWLAVVEERIVPHADSTTCGPSRFQPEARGRPGGDCKAGVSRVFPGSARSMLPNIVNLAFAGGFIF